MRAFFMRPRGPQYFDRSIASRVCVSGTDTSTVARGGVYFNNQQSLFDNHQFAAGISATDCSMASHSLKSWVYEVSALLLEFAVLLIMVALLRCSPLIRPSGTFSPARPRGEGRVALSVRTESSVRQRTEIVARPVPGREWSIHQRVRKRSE